MEPILLPNSINVETGDENQGIFTIEPCYPGYGTTLGNALRRVLLSSLDGSAITAVKIKGASHEFSAIPGVKEDVVDIILNLKSVKIKCHSDEPVTVTIKEKGEKKVTAKSIKTSNDVEVANGDQLIATLTDASTEFEMELTVERGRGYMPVENREKENRDIGMIAIDAVYTPVRNVNFEVENVRVGQMTNFDKLTLDVITDGTMTPEEAVSKAAEILRDHFVSIADAIDVGDGKKEKEEVSEKKSAKSAEAAEPKKKAGRPKKSEAKEKKSEEAE
ncbi:MAG: DNA-directed RNA polymerase subunit alpha [bacterium]|nr:DNA-directed RNA polymerase subunit alpha [bacterium]